MDSPYDGLCGVASLFTTRDGLHLPCKFELGHGGDHDWKKVEHQFYLQFHLTRDQRIACMHPVPSGCVCQPLRAEDGTIVEYVFSPDCVAHAQR
jgi:hypothetical protein